jgi:mRNA interferase RelE/StbE
MRHAIQFLPSAQKALAALSKPIQRRIDEHMRALADNPRPHGAAPLKGGGRGLWRVRVGDYRILYQIRDADLIVLVIDVAHRREVYRRL